MPISRRVQKALVVAELLLAALAARPADQRPLKQRISDPFKNNRSLNELGDVVGIKIYDRYRWEKTLQRAEQYIKSHPANRVIEITDQRISSKSALLTLKTADGKTGWMIVTFPFPDAVRIQAGLGKPPAADTSGADFAAEIFPGYLMLSSSQIRISLEKKPFHLEISDFGGRTMMAEPEDSGLELGAERCRENAVLSKGEKLFGLGEQYGEFNHAGKMLVMDQDDAYESRTGNTYLPIPFLLSSRGYGLLVNTYQRALFDLGKSDPNRLSVDNPDSNLDYIWFFAPDPKKILSEYTAFNGRTPLIPRWSLEPWISRQTIAGWRDYEAAERDVARMVREKFPVGVVLYENLLNGPAEGPELGFDPKTRPRMPEIIDEWHKLGIKVVGWIGLGQVNPNPSHLKYYGLDQHPEYLVRNPDGSPYLGGIGKDNYYLDTSNPEAMDFAWDKIYQPLFLPGPNGKSSFEKLDLDGIKLDFCEFFPPAEVPILVHERMPGMRLYHPTYFSEWMYSKINSVRPGGGITWIRGAGLGAQRIGFVWTGDRGRTFEQLDHTHIARMSASMSGIALIGTDLGGYTSGGIISEQVYNRAVAIDCFSPAFHDHGRSMPPWEQTEQGKDIYRFYARLRYNLIPYIYSLIEQAHETGAPIMRPMPLECPDDQVCWDIYDQYFLGDSLLVAPVLKNTRERKLYLPEGEWVDFWTREPACGPKWINYTVPLNIIPVFVRSGSAIPMQFNDRFELGGEFKQEDKDRMTPGFAVFGADELSLDQTFKVFDPRTNPHAVSSLKLTRTAQQISLDKISPLPAAIIIFGKKPSIVNFCGKELKEVSCSEIHSSIGWCYREKMKAAVIHLDK